MKKIGIVSEYFYPHLGGMTEHIYHFSKELIRRGYDVTLLTGRVKREGEHWQGPSLPPGLKVIEFGKSTLIFANHSFARATLGFDVGKDIRKVLAAEQFDLLHIHSPMTPTLPILFQKYSDTVTVGTVHTYFDSLPYYRLFRKILQPYLDKLDGLIAVAPSCVEAMDKYFRGHYAIIPNGVDVEWFARPQGVIEKYDDDRPTVLFLGRLDPRNGLGTLIKAFFKVLAQVPKARLVVVGEGPMRPLYERKASLHLGKAIFFEGEISNTRPEYFAASDVFCYPATKASFGITLLEAMAAGKPVVATENKGFCDMMQNGVNGLLVEQGRSDKLADALVQVLQDKNLARKLSDNGREMIRNYSWETITDRVLGFYNKISLQKRGVPFTML